MPDEPKAKKNPTSFYLTDADSEVINELTARTGLGRTGLVRLALRELLRAQRGATK